jgi:hypothetical protein
VTRRVLLLLHGALLAAGLALFVASVAAADTLTADCTSGGTTSECNTNWYTSPVTVVWTVDTGYVNGISGCQLNYAYHYLTDEVSNLSCDVTFPDGSEGARSYPFHLEASTPTVSAIPGRPPDANGWYNHPVTVSFAGNAFSGLTWCAGAATYGGPNTAGTTVAGGCTDNAGKSASASVALRYDATPPALALTATPGDQSATVHWQATTDLAPLTSLRVVRSPGMKGASPSVLAPTSGTGSYSDSHLRNRTSYTYTVTATDQAGLVTVRSVVIRPGRRLLTPASGAQLSTPPMLSWTAIPRATYYNVQIFRGGKILSAWPKRAHLRMGRSWRFAGHRYRLRRGTYQWYVWPGFGPRSAARYGARIGSGRFTVR